MYRINIIVFILSILCGFHGIGQTIIQDLEFKDIRSGFEEFEFMSQDPQGNYVVIVGKEETDHPGMVVGDMLISSHHHFKDDPFLGLDDVFLCQLSSDFQLLNSFVIDNAEVVRDVFPGSEFTLVSMYLHETAQETDSFPILLNGATEIPRQGNLGKGVVIVLDNNLEFQRFLFPSSGEIGNVAVHGHIAYFELRMPDQQPYIVLENMDTIFNHVYIDDPTRTGEQTVVLCSYDLALNQVLWTVRLGNLGYEILDEMLIDHEGNLVILGETSSTYFTFNDQDTVLNMSNHNPFIGKYSSSGELLFSEFNQLENNVFGWDLFIDSENEIFWLGFYRGDQYQTIDTVLIRPGLGRPYDSQGIITKCAENGDKSWVMQLEGDFEQSSFQSVTELNKSTLCIAGLYDTGTLIIGDSVYITEEAADDYYNFILALEKKTGQIQSHSMARINKRPLYFTNIFKNNSNQLDIFVYFIGSDTLFNKPLHSFENSVSGFLIKLAPDFLLRNNGVDFVEDLAVFPNPCPKGDYITVSGKNEQRRNISTLRVIDSMGRTLLTRIPFVDSIAQIPTEHIPPGICWIVDEGSNATIGKIYIVD